VRSPLNGYIVRQIAMKLERVAFDDDNRIDYEFLLETTGASRFWYTLIAKFRGQYRDGSAGAPDAAFIEGLTRTALEVWSPAALVLDLSELRYDWGDEMASLLDIGDDGGLKTAVVVGPGCARAIATLMWGVDTTREATEAEGIFATVEEAWTHVRKTA
jgi:hypothetical protein